MLGPIYLPPCPASTSEELGTDCSVLGRLGHVQDSMMVRSGWMNSGQAVQRQAVGPRAGFSGGFCQNRLNLGQTVQKQLDHMQDSAVVLGGTVELWTGCFGSSAAGPLAGFVCMLDLA